MKVLNIYSSIGCGMKKAAHAKKICHLFSADNERQNTSSDITEDNFENEINLWDVGCAEVFHIINELSDQKGVQ